MYNARMIIYYLFVGLVVIKIASRDSPRNLEI